MKTKSNILLMTLSLFVFSCQSQEKINKEFILNFEKEIHLNPNANLKSLKKYLDLHETVENSIHFKEMIDYRKMVGKELNKNSRLRFKIISYKEANQSKVYSNSINYKKLKYDNKKYIYYVIYPSIEDKIAHTIILNDNGKIISFYSYFRTGKDPVVPFMLNQEHSIDYIGKPFK